MTQVDVSVRGAGIFGLSIAWTCLQRGARVELVDPHGVAAGASGSIVGALAPHVPENWNPKKQFQFESLLLAEPFWRGVEQASGARSGYVRAGRMQPIATQEAAELAQARGVGAQTLWQGEATWQVGNNAGGWDVPSETGQYVTDTLSAHIHPPTACLALAGALATHGIEVRKEPALPPAKATIWATGAAGLDALSQGRSRLVGQGIKGQAALLDADFAGRPQLFVDGLHIIPHLDGTVAVGSTTERTFEDPNRTDAQLDDIIARVRRDVPELADAAVLARWAGLRPRARSRAPMLGPWRDRPAHFIANGGFKIGFGMAPKVAEVMADLVLDGKDHIPSGFEVSASF